jgi:hypothetical protein
LGEKLFDCAIEKTTLAAKATANNSAFVFIVDRLLPVTL